MERLVRRNRAKPKRPLSPFSVFIHPERAAVLLPGSDERTAEAGRPEERVG
jgi:hypothetical protein